MRKTLCGRPFDTFFIQQGELDEHEKLVEAIRQVDIVIVTLGMPPIMDQLKIIAAMKEAGNVKVSTRIVWKFCELGTISVYTFGF